MVSLSRYRLGQLAMDENRLHEALIHFETALPVLEKDRKSKNTQALVAYAQLLGRLERYKDSLEALARVRALLPINSPGGMVLLQYCCHNYARLDNYREAYQYQSMLRQVEKRKAAKYQRT
jgi:tetratricopeptide (TPR) repeat protein